MGGAAYAETGRGAIVAEVHGTEDGCWPYEGGPITCQNPDNTIPVVGAEPSTAAWADRNGCAAGPTTTPGPERVDDGISVELLEWSGCRAPTRLFRVLGGGHTWLGGRQFLPVETIGPAYPDLNNEDVWAFLRDLRR
jgi:polyhydroxybutyrate depolymerase